MEIRKAKAADIEQIMSVIAEGRAALAALDLDQWQGKYPDRALIEADIARGDSYVGVIEDTECAGVLGVGQNTELTSCPDVSQAAEYAGVSGEADKNPGRIVSSFMLGFAGDAIYDEIERGAWLTSSRSHNARYAAVHRVAVAANYRGKGAASAIMTFAEEIARTRGAESVRIDTHPGNIPMQNLCAKMGYTKCGIVHLQESEGAIDERIAYEKLVSKSALV